MIFYLANTIGPDAEKAPGAGELSQPAPVGLANAPDIFAQHKKERIAEWQDP
jgi:hypothetical protein